MAFVSCRHLQGFKVCGFGFTDFQVGFWGIFYFWFARCKFVLPARDSDLLIRALEKSRGMRRGEGPEVFVSLHFLVCLYNCVGGFLGLGLSEWVGMVQRIVLGGVWG